MMAQQDTFCVMVETTGLKGSVGLYTVSMDKKRAGAPWRFFRALQKVWDGPYHSASLTSAFEAILQELKPDIQKLRFVALGIGPGRFTGVRTGLSFAKTLGFLLNIPIYPVSSLKILAESQADTIKEGAQVLALINAFKNSVYMALYQKKGLILKELIAPACLTALELEPEIKEMEKEPLSYKGSFGASLGLSEGASPPRPQYICVGDGYSIYKSFLSSELKKRIHAKPALFPEVGQMMSLLQKEGHLYKPIYWKDLQAVYLRSPVKILNSPTL